MLGPRTFLRDKIHRENGKFYLSHDLLKLQKKNQLVMSQVVDEEVDLLRNFK